MSKETALKIEVEVFDNGTGKININLLKDISESVNIPCVGIVAEDCFFNGEEFKNYASTFTAMFNEMTNTLINNLLVNRQTGESI